MSRELDAEIAERIFGYTLDYEFADMMFDGAPCVKELRSRDDEWGVLPFYSTEIGDAWLVAEHLYHSGMWDITIRVSPVSGQWECRLEAPNRTRNFFGRGWAAPEAICRAALAAVKGARG